MNYGDIRSDFMMKLNRRDITPTQVDNYIKGAIQRTQRLLRVPASERSTIYYVGSDYESMPVPADYLKLVSLRLNDDHELVRVGLNQVLAAAKYPGIPAYFYRDEENFIIGPRPQEGARLRIVYHSDFSLLTDPADTNWLTDVAADVIVNGALSSACRTYVDPRRDSYEADFIQAVTDLNIQASDDELLNSSISPAYSFDCE